MAVYLQIENLTKSYGDRILFESVTFGVEEGDKIGLIARNGTGKTTMLRIIAGKESADSGTVTFRNGIKVGMLEQLPEFTPEDTVTEACISPDTPTRQIISRYESAMASGDADEIAEASSAMDAAGAWSYDDRLRQMLTRLGITDMNARMGNLSGGQRKRVALARLLLEEPDMLILDEPTNHLDIDVIEWLENHLKRSRVTLLMVTHDRYFLDRVCNSIIEIDRQSIYTYKGNFDYYLRRRAERIEAMAEELARVKNTLRKEQDWMRRQPQARAGKAKYRIDEFYRLQEQSKVDLTDRSVSIEGKSSYIGSKIFEAKNVSKRFGDKIILRDFNYIFARYERVGIIGPNGAGKSTFVKMLQGLIQPDSGSWDVGTTVKFGYYSQDGIKFDPEKKVIDAVTEIADDIVLEGGARFSPLQYLGKWLFSPKDVVKRIADLSGGERSRLHLAVVLMTNPNFLILDEPTNDLDIMTLGLLQEFLSTFGGCLIVITHDRFFLDNVVNHLFVLDDNNTGLIRDFPGTYTEYREKMLDEQKASQPAVQPKPAPKQEVRRTPKLTYAERKELESLEALMPKLEVEKASLEQIFSDGADADKIAEASKRYEEIKEQLDEAEMRWLELSEKEQSAK